MTQCCCMNRINSLDFCYFIKRDTTLYWTYLAFEQKGHFLLTSFIKAHGFIDQSMEGSNIYVSLLNPLWNGNSFGFIIIKAISFNHCQSLQVDQIKFTERTKHNLFLVYHNWYFFLPLNVRLILINAWHWWKIVYLQKNLTWIIYISIKEKPQGYVNVNINTSLD